MLMAGFDFFAQVPKFANLLEFIDLDVPQQSDSHTCGWRVIYNAKLILDHYYNLVSMVPILYNSLQHIKTLFLLH